MDLNLSGTTGITMTKPRKMKNTFTGKTFWITEMIIAYKQDEQHITLFAKTKKDLKIKTIEK